MTGEPALKMDPQERRIVIHGPDDFAGMRRAGRLAAETLDFITQAVEPGISAPACRGAPARWAFPERVEPSTRPCLP